MTRHAQTERLELCTAFREVGPDAPTMCEGWDARDLAIHLVIRDGKRPAALVGQAIPFLRNRYIDAARELSAMDFDALVDIVADGPAKFSPAALPPVDSLMNTVEFYVHHEDVLRAQQEWEPRQLDMSLNKTLWNAGRLALFQAAAAKQKLCITFDSPEFGMCRAGSRSAPALTVHGPAQELVLWAFGRTSVARVETYGEPAAAE